GRACRRRPRLSHLHALPLAEHHRPALVVGGPMRTEDLLTHFPQLYHMAEAGTWKSVRREGLLSTTALLDAFEIDGDLRCQIESCHRPECITISHPRLGTAVIRDQKPMSDRGLGKCLQGMTPREWYET